MQSFDSGIPSFAVARMQQSLGASIVTLNMDYRHERAGVANLLHPYGRLVAPRCATCQGPQAEPPPLPPLGVQHQHPQRLKPPVCQHCGGHIRPVVVWLVENLDYPVIQQAIEHIRSCDLLILLGTAWVVYPAASIISVVKRGTTIFEINPEPGSASGRMNFQWRVRRLDYSRLKIGHQASEITNKKDLHIDA